MEYADWVDLFQEKEEQFGVERTGGLGPIGISFVCILCLDMQQKYFGNLSRPRELVVKNEHCYFCNGLLQLS
jgi:hypothetical protein